MSSDSTVKFLWSDAWLVHAAGMAATSGDSDLATVIATGDAIQHAIFTRSELNGAIGRLQRAGLLAYDGGALRLTPNGSELFSNATAVGRTIRRHADALEVALGAEPCHPKYRPHEAAGNEVEVVSSEEYERALRAYYRTSRRSRPRRPKHHTKRPNEEL